MSKITIQQAIDQLQSGNVIIYPTEGVWGIGCDSLQEKAIARIYQLKDRPKYKPFLVITSNLSQIKPWIKLSKDQETTILDCTETTTWLVPCTSQAPKILTQNDKIAFRISTHPTCRALCDGIGRPIISTSANKHACDIDPSRFESDFKDTPVVEGTLGTIKKASRIIDIVSMAQLR